MATEGNFPSVLIAGCGSIGKRHARVLRGLGVADIRVCDPSPEQRNGLASQTPVQMYSSYEDGLAGNPDTVFICTPPKSHVPMAIRALEGGAHVFCEKPLSFSSEGIDNLVVSAQRAGKSVMVGLCFRYHEGLLKAKAMLESGSFGRLVSIRCLVGEHLPSARADYRTLFSSKYSGAFDLSHEVDLAVWYAGQPVGTVQCLAGSLSDIGIEAPDIAEILVGFEGRCFASIHLDFFQTPRRRQTELICTRGVILVEFARWDRCVISTCIGTGEWTHEELATDRDDMFRAEDSSFLASVVGNRAVECGISEARKSVEIIEQACLAAGLGASLRGP
jgi:predicted dehydrogenase